MATGIIGVISASSQSQTANLTYSPSTDSKISVTVGMAYLSNYGTFFSVNGVQICGFWASTYYSTASHVEFFMWIRAGSSVTFTVSSGQYSGTIGAVISALES